jgi:membrane protease YdiL (CAAX protease family)
MSDIGATGEVGVTGESAGELPLDAIVVEPPPRLPGPGIWAAIGWTLLLVVALNVLGIVLTIALMIVGADLEDAMLVLLPVSSVAVTLFAVTVAAAMFGRQMSRILAWRAPSNWQLVLTVLLVAPLGTAVQEIAAWAGEVLPSFNAEYYEAFAEGPWVLVLIAGCLLPGIGEEIFFRGFLGRGLLARWGLAWGILWTSLLFAAIHLDPTQAVGITFIGIALHLVYLTARSLLVPMLLHALNNALSFGLTKAGLFSELDHLPAPLVATGLMALLPLGVLLWQTRSRWVLPEGGDWTPGYLSAESPPPELGAQVLNGRPALGWLVLLVFSQVIFWTVAVRVA